MSGPRLLAGPGMSLFYFSLDADLPASLPPAEFRLGGLGTLAAVGLQCHTLARFLSAILFD